MPTDRRTDRPTRWLIGIVARGKKPHDDGNWVRYKWMSGHKTQQITQLNKRMKVILNLRQVTVLWLLGISNATLIFYGCPPPALPPWLLPLNFMTKQRKTFSPQMDTQRKKPREMWEVRLNFMTILVACTRLNMSLCRSVGPNLIFCVFKHVQWPIDL